MNVDHNVLEKSERLVARHERIAILAIAHVIRPRFVVGLICLASSSHERGVGTAVVVVRVVECVVPWRESGWCSHCERVVPWMAIWMNRVLDAEHVELRCVTAILVVSWVDFGWFGVDRARVRVAPV